MADTMKVLIPLDGSKLAEHSLAYVAALRPLGLSLVEAVSVLEPPPIHLRRGQEDEARERNLLSTYLDQLAEDLRSHTTLDVQTKVLSGQSAEAIIGEAEAFQPDYLIVSTHGASGISRWRFGSVADKVIRGVSCPTLVLGPKAAEREERFAAALMPVFRSVLVPLDGSQLAEQALPAAQRFVEGCGSEVHLVTAISLSAMGGDAAWAGASPQLLENLTEDARKYLEDVVSRAPGLGKVSTKVLIGGAAEALSDYMADNVIDLAIMTSHGRGGVTRTALGSTTDRLIGSGPPVLVVHARE